MIKIYLDVCCLNRPFDDWSYERNRLEGESVTSILQLFNSEQYKLVSSEVVEVELRKMKNLDKLKQIKNLLKKADHTIILNQEIDARSQELEKLGFGLYDSFHIASAEYAMVDVLLTTDDRLLKKALKYQDLLKVKLDNPVIWLMNNILLKGD
ncbi:MULTISPECIES: PIN domain-containing protein [Cyanobacterium]|uniref:PIN domain-containing protein n=1 Tax=Cyanobacterium aponinum (strain PCC 10605) TaxID=755178 RepID=K9Z8M6_CYAAP|nr:MULTISPECIES: PIN domain-containing protein [Cyanobacterium]AFZ54698.1 hypothetical protein Cyan10605_2623 [Cyanobacterium aponinum PCC 10605]PHV61557.1 hypothetical protein CSQ80_15015 [Cyanobacterium aponinum IPPAS B-1201]WVK99842.1 hypothetical protein Dongsha4_14380 [Cyanobacterium sp. Dongsha4]